MTVRGYEHAVLFEHGVAGQDHPGYLLQRELGSGGQATVYLGWDQSKTQERGVCAVKIFAPFSNDPGDRRLRQFLSEGRRAIEVRHDNLLPTYTFNLGTIAVRGAEYIHPFIRMAYAEGGSLQDDLRQRQPSAPEAATIIQGIANGTQAIHDQGMLHLDLKPANVLWYQGRPVVTDLGIAIDGHDINTQSQISNPHIEGTPHYMSPEHLQGKPVKQSDTYAAGIIAYQLLTGTFPFKVRSVDEVIAAHLLREPLAFKEVTRAFAIPLYLEQAELVVRLALSKDPARRPPSIVQFGNMLARALTERRSVQLQPPSAPPTIREQPTFRLGQKPMVGRKPPLRNEQHISVPYMAAELAVKALADQARAIDWNDSHREHERRNMLEAMTAIGKAVCLFNVEKAEEIAKHINRVPGSLDYEFALRVAMAAYDPEAIIYSPTHFRNVLLSTCHPAIVAEILLDPNRTPRQLRGHFDKNKPITHPSLIPLLAKRNPEWAAKKAKHRDTPADHIADLARSLLPVDLEGAKQALYSLERLFYAGSSTYGGHDEVVPTALQFIPFAPDEIRNLIYRRIQQGPRFARAQYNSVLRLGLSRHFPDEVTKALEAEKKNSGIPSWFNYVQNPQNKKALEAIIASIQSFNDHEHYWMRVFAIAAVVAHQPRRN